MLAIIGIARVFMQLSHADWFPTGLVTKEGFCNREEERNRLKRNIASGRHTLLVAPRRYGKSSLVRQVIMESKAIYGEADLFIAADTQRIQLRILAGIHAIINQIKGSIKSKIDILMHLLNEAGSAWSVGVHGLNINFNLVKDKDPASNLLDALVALELFLAKKKKKAVLFIDEIQIIGEIEECRSLEGAIRHVAQESKYLTFVFAGSRRHLVHEMFNNDSRPLYHICEQIHLERISAEHYKEHLNNLAKKQWKQVLPDSVLENILTVTERHPYYVNLLCFQLWELEELPNKNQVEKTWNSVVLGSRAGIIGQLDGLSQAQIKLLIHIAEGNVGNLTSRESIAKLQLAGSHIKSLLTGLVKKDFLEKLPGNEYTIINPMIKTILELYYPG